MSYHRKRRRTKISREPLVVGQGYSLAIPLILGRLREIELEEECSDIN